MPYIPINTPKTLETEICALVNRIVDSWFNEFRYLLQQGLPTAGPKGSLHGPLLALLLILTDGLSQVFYVAPKGSGNKQRFIGFLLNYYPWELDPPDGVTNQETVGIIYDVFRNGLVHSLGLRTSDVPFVQKIGRVHTQSDESLTKLEGSIQRPSSDPTFRKDETRFVIWIDGYYWGLRRTLERALADPNNGANLYNWIQSGKYAQLKV